MKKIVIMLILALSFTQLYSQSDEEIRTMQDNLNIHSVKYGLFFDYNPDIISSHNADFMKFKDLDFNNETNFKDGEVSGSGMNIGLFYDWPYNKTLGVQFRVSFSTINGIFKTQEIEPVSKWVNGDLEIIDANWEYSIEPSISAFSGAALVNYEFYEKVNFNIGFGFSILSSPNFKQNEALLTAEAPNLADGTRERNKLTDEAIPDESIFLSVPLGLTYNYQISNNLELGFNVLYNIGLNSIASSPEIVLDDSTTQAGTWNYSALTAGISIAFVEDRPCPPGMYRNEDGRCEWEPCPPGMHRNEFGECVCRPGMIINDKGFCEWPPCPERNQQRNEDGECVQVLYADVVIDPILPSGESQDAERLKMKEAETYISQPLLNYVFFDENDAKVPERYSKWDTDDKIGTFRIGQIADPENPLNTYYNILNIIGYRMSNSPFAELELITYNMPDENNNKKISRERVDLIRNYFIDIWKVPDYRVKTQVYNLPLEVEDTDNKDIISEYRRVEIKPDSNNVSITGPIPIDDYVYKSFPSQVNFNLDVIPMTRIDKWNLKAMQGDEVHFETQGSGTPPEIVSWYPNEKDERYKETEGAVEYAIEVSDANSDELSQEKPLSMTWISFNPNSEPEEHDSTYSIYHLLFSLNDEKIDADINMNSDVLDGIEFSMAESRFRIRGYTDRVGNSRSNKILSQKRVDAVAKFLTDEMNIGSESILKEGLGHIELFDNNKPEGRFYNRAVMLDIATPALGVKAQDINELVKGCYVIVYSSEERIRAQSVFDILEQRGIGDVYIEEYIDKALDKKYYRVRSKIYPEVQEAVVARAKISIVTKQMNLEKPPTLKCEK